MSRKHQERITEFWSSIGHSYDQHPGNVVAPESQEYSAWVEAVRTLLPSRPCDVLDVGTGTGLLAFITASLGHRVTAINLAEGMLAVARAEADRRALHPRLVCGDAVAISTAIQFCIFVTIGWVSVDVQIVRRPVFAIPHPSGGMDRAGSLIAFC